MAKAALAKRPESHPLIVKPISAISSWDQWLALWNRTDETEVLTSLLHYGFDAEGRMENKLRFYLALAEGVQQGSYLTAESDYPQPRRQYSTPRRLVTSFPKRRGTDSEIEIHDLRGRIRRKAWEVLCVRLEKDLDFQGFGALLRAGWYLDDLLGFFTPEPGRINLPSRLQSGPRDYDRYDESARAYVLNHLVPTAWLYSLEKKLPAMRRQIFLILFALEEPWRVLNLRGITKEILGEILPFALRQEVVSQFSRLGSLEYKTLEHALKDEFTEKKSWPWAEVYVVLRERLK